jgi:putative hemolysin
MSSSTRIARRISYADSAPSLWGRAVIRSVENATGRLTIVRRAWGYEEEIAKGRDVWEVICGCYGLGIEVIGGRLEDIPAEGPLVLVANHPYGILDGLTFGRILSRARAGRFKMLAHRIFTRSPELARNILPVNFDETKDATRENLATRSEALQWLSQGGAVGIFPGGTVSTSLTPWGRPLDPAWRTFTAKMIARSEATVVPIFFEGQNSRLFQIASHLHYTLRLGLLLREFKTRLDTRARVVVGRPIPRPDLDRFATDPRGMMDFLRQATYDLSPRPPAPDALGHDFEAGKRRDGGGHLRQRPGWADGS